MGQLDIRNARADILTSVGSIDRCVHNLRPLHRTGGKPIIGHHRGRGRELPVPTDSWLETDSLLHILVILPALVVYPQEAVQLVAPELALQGRFGIRHQQAPEVVVDLLPPGIHTHLPTEYPFADAMRYAGIIARRKQPQIQQMTLGNTSKTDIKGDAEKADQAIEADYISEQGGDDTTEKFNKAQEKAQEVLREAVSQLYAIGFTTRTNMTKETPTDNAMKASDQILQETNTKAMKCVQRLAAIYTLESMIQSYQMLENMQSVIIDASQEEKKEGDN